METPAVKLQSEDYIYTVALHDIDTIHFHQFSINHFINFNKDCDCVCGIKC